MVEIARRLVTVLVALTMITAPSVGSVTASGGTSPGSATSLDTTSVGPVAGALDPGDIVNATESVGIWQGSVLTLRADETVGEIQLENANWNIEHTELDVNQDLNKDPVAVYDVGTTIPLDFDDSRGGDNLALANTDVQLVAARIEGNQSATLSSISTVEGLKELVDEDAANDNATFELVSSTTLDSGGDGSFSYTPTAPGQYVLFLATNETGGFAVDGNGNISLVGDTTIVGADHVAVQRGRSTVTTDKTNYASGENVTFDADTTTDGVVQTDPGENVHHAVVLYDESTYTGSVFNVKIEGEVDSSFNVSENVTLEHSIARVQGVGRNVNAASAFGVTVDGGRSSGLITFQSVLEFISENTSISNALVPKNTATGSTVWNASLTVKNGTADDTIVVETLKDWPAGEYRWVHMATDEEGTEFAADTGTIQVQDQPATFEFVDGTISISPDTALDTEPVTVTVDLENTGEGAGTQSVTLELDGSAFSSQDVTLNASERKTVTFTLAAGTVPAGSHTIGVTVNDKSSGTASLTVEEASPDISLNTSSLGFGNVDATPGGSAQSVEHLNVTNNGTATLKLDSLSLVGTDADQFEITANGSSAELEPGESRIVAVIFRPTRHGSASATLSIGSSAPRSPTNVSLTGTGQAGIFVLDTASPLTFGTKDTSTTTSKTVSITNDGNKALTISKTTLKNIQGSAFSISGVPGSIASGATDTITVTFNPTSGGSKTASLKITTDDPFNPTRTITLGGAATQRSMAVAPKAVAFGNVTWGGQNGTANVAVENTGTVSLTIEAQSAQVTTGQGGFSVGTESFTLAPGQSRFVALELNATATGTISGSVTFNATNAADVSKTVSFDATGRKAEISATPAPLDFGETALQGASTASVDIGNGGDATLVVNTTSAFNASERGNFSLVGAPDEFEVAPGGTRTLTLSYSPTTAGLANATLTLHTNDPDAGDTVRNVSVGGLGVQTEFNATQSAVAFGSVANGTTSQQTVTLRNPSASSVTITDVQITGADAGQFSNDSISSTTIAPDGSVTLPVTFAPTSGGSKSASLVITGDTGAGSQTISLTLSGTSTTPTASFDPLTVPVQGGFIKAGSSASTSVTVKNTGPSGTTLRITGVSIGGTGSGAFSTTASPTITVSSGASTTIPIAFEPSTNGAKRATLTLTTNDPDNPTITARLLGTGAAPVASLSSGSLSFGQVGNGFTAQRTLTIANDGGSTLTIGSGGLAISGTNSDKFSIVGSSRSRTIAPGGSARVTVEVAPTAGGSLSASLDITTNEGGSTPQHKVGLSATGTTPTLTVTDSDGAALSNASTLGFGDTGVGSATTKTVTVENTGTARLKLPSPSLAGADIGDYQITSGESAVVLTPGSTAQYAVAFSPDATGSKTATIVFDGTNDPATTRYQLDLTGTGTQAEATLDPAAVSFGEVAVGGTESESVTLENTGSAPFTISSVAISGADAGAFSNETIPVSTVPADGSTSFDVTAAPTVRGGLSATLAITVSTSSGTQTVTASLGATGTAANVELKQVPVDLGTVLLGNESATTIYVNNTGNDDLTISGISLAGDGDAFDVSPTSATVGPTESQALTVTFAPTDSPAHEGSLEAVLQVSSNDPDTPTITRNLTGVGESPNVTVTPRSLQFGSVALGSSVTRNVTVTNELSGTANVTIDDLRTIPVPGFDSAAYSVSDTSPFTLVPGQSKQVEVTFNPTSASPSQKFAMLAVETTDPRVGTRNVWLSNTDLRIELTYGSVNATYFDPDPGVQPEVDLSQDLDRNATLETLTVEMDSRIGRDPIDDFYLDFETSPSRFDNQLGVAEDVPLQYVNVTETVTNTGHFQDATIEFAVKKSVMNTYGLEIGDVTLRHHDGSSYDELTTTKVNETDTTYVFSATTSDFSEFVVAGDRESDTLSLSANRTEIDEGQAIEFTVTNGDGTGVPDATVTVAGGVSGTTDADGEVSLTPTRLGTYDVTVSESDDTVYYSNSPLTESDYITIRSVVTLSVTASPTSVDQGEDVTFTVTDADTDDAVEDASVSFAGNTGTTDADGNVTLSADRAGAAVTATASKSQTTTTRYVSDTVDVDVDATGGGGGGGGGGDVRGAGPTPVPPRPAPAVSAAGQAQVTASSTAERVTVQIRNAAPGDRVTVQRDAAEVAEQVAAAGSGLESIETAFTGATDFDMDISSSVEKPDPAAPDPPTDAVGYLRVDHEADDDAIGSVTFTFQVSGDRLAERGLDPEDVALYRFSDGAWTALETEYLGPADDGTPRFRALSPGLSVFAIGQRQAQVTTTPGATATTTEAPPTEETTEPPTATTTTTVQEPAGIDPWLVAILALVVFGVLGLLYYRRQQRG